MVNLYPWNTSLATGLSDAASTVSGQDSKCLRGQGTRAGVTWQIRRKGVTALCINQGWECWAMWTLQQASSVMSLHRVENWAKVSVVMPVPYWQPSTVLVRPSVTEVRRLLKWEYLKLLLYVAWQVTRLITEVAEEDEAQEVEPGGAAGIILCEELVILVLTGFSCALWIAHACVPTPYSKVSVIRIRNVSLFYGHHVIVPCSSIINWCIRNRCAQVQYDTSVLSCPPEILYVSVQVL